MSSNQEFLKWTKKKLAEELVANGVVLPPRQLMLGEYQALYLDQVLGRQKETETKKEKKSTAVKRSADEIADGEEKAQSSTSEPKKARKSIVVDAEIEDEITEIDAPMPPAPVVASSPGSSVLDERPQVPASSAAPVQTSPPSQPAPPTPVQQQAAQQPAQPSPVGTSRPSFAPTPSQNRTTTSDVFKNVQTPGFANIDLNQIPETPSVPFTPVQPSTGQRSAQRQSIASTPLFQNVAKTPSTVQRTSPPSSAASAAPAPTPQQPPIQVPSTPVAAPTTPSPAAGTSSQTYSSATPRTPYIAKTPTTVPPSTGKGTPRKILSEGSAAPTAMEIVINVLFFTFWVGFMVVAVWGALPQRRPRFCNTDGPSPAGCANCPESGYCVEGVLFQCNRGFINRGGIACVRDEKVDQVAYDIVKKIKALLSARRGEHECGSPVPSEISEPELKSMLQQKSKVGIRIPKNIEFDLCFKRAVEMLNSERPSVEIVREEVPVIVDGEETLSAIFHSERSVLPLRCIVARNVRENHVSISVTAAVVIFVSSCLYWKRRAQRDERDAKAVLRSVVRALEKAGSSGRSVALLKQDMRSAYEPKGVMFDKVWSMVETMITQDHRLECREDPVNYLAVWAWKGDRK